MKTRLWIAALTLLCATACTENETSQLPDNNKTYTAVMEQPDGTRSTVTDQGVFSWAEGDAIKVICKNSSGTYEAKDIVLTVSDGKATFSLPAGYSEPTYAVYSAQDVTFDNDGKLTGVTLNGSYGDADTPYRPDTHAIMFADMNDYSESRVTFRHLAGVLCIKINKIPAGASKFVFEASNNGITGAFNVDVSEATPQIEAFEEPESSDRVFSYSFQPTAAESSMTFYVPLPVGQYFAATVRLFSDTNVLLFEKKSSTAFAAIHIERRTLGFLPEVGSETVESIGTYAELKEALTGFYGKAKFTLTSGFTVDEPICIDYLWDEENTMCPTISLTGSGAGVTLTKGSDAENIFEVNGLDEYDYCSLSLENITLDGGGENSSRNDELIYVMTGDLTLTNVTLKNFRNDVRDGITYASSAIYLDSEGETYSWLNMSGCHIDVEGYAIYGGGNTYTYFHGKNTIAGGVADIFTDAVESLDEITVYIDDALPKAEGQKLTFSLYFPRGATEAYVAKLPYEHSLTAENFEVKELKDSYGKIQTLSDYELYVDGNYLKLRQKASAE